MAEISASQYGQQRGISKQRISAAIKAEKLDKCMKRNADGSLWRDPKTGGFLLDPELADYEWSKNVGLHPNGKRTDDGNQPNLPETPAPISLPKKNEPRPAAPNAQTPKYMESRTSRETYLAEMARLDLEERLGQLVSADAVTHMLEKVVSETKTRILAVPGKAKSLIPHLKTDDVLLLDSLLREAMTELADARLVQ